MAKFAVRVDRPRKGAGYALMFFNLSLGVGEGEDFQGIFTVTDLSLMKSKDGEYYWRGPSKQRMKSGEPVMIDGKAKYDELFRLYAEEVNGEFGVTKAAHSGRKEVLSRAVAVYEAQFKDAESKPAGASSSGRGGAAKKEKPVTAAATTGSSAKSEGLFDEDTDDDLPF